MGEYLVMAFLGGVILNVMPCVLPVLTLKVFHTIEVFGKPGHNPRLHGIFYAAGTTAAFSAFAVAIIALRASGEVMGWGMHFQHPPFVALLTALIFAFGLNALGVFEINIGMRGGTASGYWGTFVNGLFAAIMSTPCTAPFLGTAAGFALAGDTTAWQTLVLFATIGFGLAFPYVLVGFVPALARLLPRPGAWMVTFKHLMGFTLMAAAVWLFAALMSQVTPAGASSFLAFLLVLAVGLWAVGRHGAIHHPTLQRWLVRSVSGAALVVAGITLIDLTPPAKATTVAADFEDGPIVIADKINWRVFDPARIADAHERGRPVFVDYTADWCAACKANERFFLETKTVRDALVETNVLPMQADLTNSDEVIESWLDRLKRDGKAITGIPAYAIYLPDETVDVLPVTITADMVAERLALAAERFPSRRGGS